MENMTSLEYAWIWYLVGALGCSLATGLLFRRLGRAWVHFFVITVMAILFTPYAIDAETMTMAPAMYSLVFLYMDSGFEAIKPVLKVILIVWVVALILSLIYQLLTRKAKKDFHDGEAYSEQNFADSDLDTQDRDKVREADNRKHLYAESVREHSAELTREEHDARDELLHEKPIIPVR